MTRTLESPRAADFAVVLCADHKYFVPAYAVCLDLARSQGEGIDIYLLTEDGPHLKKIPDDVPFNVLTPKFADRLPDIPELWRTVTPFGYLRLLLPDVVPGYRRILYLDSDVRVDGSIAPLFALDMQGTAVAAVDGLGTYYRTPIKSKQLQSDQARMGALGFDPAAAYFNSGVLLIDCEKWNSDRMSDAAVDCMRRFGLSLASYDQDVLNIIFHKAWLALSPRWNFPSQVFETELEAIIEPVVYHNLFKPWELGNASRREISHFRKLLQATPYRDFRQGMPPLREIRRFAEARAKELMQYATFFLPSSYQRLQHRNPNRIQRAVAEHVIENVRSRRFADVDQNISHIDIAALLPLLRK